MRDEGGGRFSLSGACGRSLLNRRFSVAADALEQATRTTRACSLSVSILPPVLRAGRASSSSSPSSRLCPSPNSSSRPRSSTRSKPSLQSSASPSRNSCQRLLRRFVSERLPIVRFSRPSSNHNSPARACLAHTPAPSILISPDLSPIFEESESPRSQTSTLAAFPPTRIPSFGAPAVLRSASSHAPTSKTYRPLSPLLRRAPLTIVRRSFSGTREIPALARSNELPSLHSLLFLLLASLWLQVPPYVPTPSLDPVQPPSQTQSTLLPPARTSPTTRAPRTNPHPRNSTTIPLSHKTSPPCTPTLPPSILPPTPYAGKPRISKKLSDRSLSACRSETSCGTSERSWRPRAFRRGTGLEVRCLVLRCEGMELMKCSGGGEGEGGG